MVLLPEVGPGSPEKPAAEVRLEPDLLLVLPQGLLQVPGMRRVLKPVPDRLLERRQEHCNRGPMYSRPGTHPAADLLQGSCQEAG